MLIACTQVHFKLAFQKEMIPVTLMKDSLILVSFLFIIVNCNPFLLSLHVERVK